MPKRMPEVFKEASATDIWRMAVNKGRKYLLAGDSDHSDARIRMAVINALPVLRRADFRHLGLEQDRNENQGPLDAFQFASAKSRRTAADYSALVDYLFTAASTYALNDRQAILADREAACNLSLVSRVLGVRLHCLNNLGSFKAFLVAHNEKEPDKFDRFAEYAFRHLKAPPRITAANQKHLLSMIGQYMDYNLACDSYRANELQLVAGKDRAALLFGSGHFGRMDGRSIEDFLPRKSSTFVYVGSSASIRKHMRQYRKGKRSLPDFAINIDKDRGYAFAPVAVAQQIS